MAIEEHIKVTEYLGATIYVDPDTGKFESRLSNGQVVEDRTLSKVKKYIAEDEPTITLMEVQRENRYLSSASVRKTTKTRTELNRMIRRLESQDGVLPDYAELDEAKIAEVGALYGESQRRRAEIQREFEEKAKMLCDAITPITVERAQELMEAEAKRLRERR